MGESKHVLCITGGTGFIGRHLLEECLSQSRFSLRVLARNLGALEGLAGDRLTICQGDLLQPKSLGDFMVPGGTLLHLAHSRDHGEENLRAGANVIGAARHANVARVVYCSSATVVGFRWRGTVSEETPARPENTYQRTKYALEQMFREYLLPDVELAILRPTEVLGPRGGGLQTMLRRLRTGRRLQNACYRFLLHARRLNYVSVGNVVAALILLATTPTRQAGDVYFISDDEDDDNKYVAVERLVREALGQKPNGYARIGLPSPALRFLFRFQPGRSNPDRVYSHAKLDALGYQPVTSLRSAITSTVGAWMARSGELRPTRAGRSKAPR